MKKPHGKLPGAVGGLLALLALCFLVGAGGKKEAPTQTDGDRVAAWEAGVSAREEEQTATEESGPDVFTLYDRAQGKTLRLSAEELLPAALACEMDLYAPEEALKAQAVACYTLFCRDRLNGEAIPCDSEGWQVWTSEQAMRERWGEDYSGYREKLEEIINQVRGELLEYEGRPILAAYFAISAGATESAADVWQQDLPYLRPVASPGDAFCDGFLSEVRLSDGEFMTMAEAAFPEEPLWWSTNPAEWLSDLEYSPSGYVLSGKLGGKTVSGLELRGAFSLRSASFTLEHSEEGFCFSAKGWGHGVGMSQAGAVFLAKRGESYEDILAWYYPGARLVKP